MEKPPKFESAETSKSPSRTLERRILETLPTGEEIEEVIECNGINHRRCVDKVSYGADGEIEYVDEISKEDLGPCDKNHS